MARMTPSLKVYGPGTPQRMAEIESRRSNLAAMTPDQRVDLALKNKQAAIDQAAINANRYPGFGYVGSSYDRTFSPNYIKPSGVFKDFLERKGVSEEEYYSEPLLVEEFRAFNKYGSGRKKGKV